MRRTTTAVLLLCLGLILVACSGDDESVESTTSTTAAPATSQATTSAPRATEVPATDAPSTSTTEAITGEVDFPDYRIVSRTRGDAGDTVVVLIEPDADEALTDIDLQNVLADIVETFPPILEAHVVDSMEAAALVLSDEIDAEALSVLDQHYLVRLEDGFRIVFTGPFADAGTLILGS